jgi:L-lactate dehydrogenase complex protein LldG
LQALLQVASIDYEMNDVLWEQAEVGVILAEMLVAETGSIIISSKRASGRKWVTFPPIQIVVAFTSQILPTLAEALQAYHTKYADSFPSMLSVITAPSQTADIERTLVMGAHGAKELVVFLIEESVES